MTYQEIGERLGMSLAGVKRHLGAARLLLATRLRALGGEQHAFG